MKVAHWSAAGPEGVLAQLTALEVLLEVRSMVKATLTIGTDGRPVAKTDPASPRPARSTPAPPSPACSGSSTSCSAWSATRCWSR
ncbi:Methyl-accepting chemotaxis protein I (serine chemoreceptor protein) [Pseudonocardia sp. Ae717_Ps2]|uniref:hypothetical protein n=1 Tax=Pseudonocardia sp. Ae717_Ps2 TaxID=1885573 RepID=UPI00094AE070|nr:hypothetical protein [Pseudonocardia sp. Ae717_Ps2]OLM27707.1 Methyl-accepting chemotaxis protein I (serine chemoreceptor protein) [Pseudonocardia sp. Ae717_Ps2]